MNLCLVVTMKLLLMTLLLMTLETITLLTMRLVSLSERLLLRLDGDLENGALRYLLMPSSRSAMIAGCGDVVRSSRAPFRYALSLFCFPFLS